MQEIADSGAKVLHNRCIQVGEKFNCNIVAKSTFSDNRGTSICKNIENAEIKSIVKSENLINIKVTIAPGTHNEIYKELLSRNIIPEAFSQIDEDKLAFRINKTNKNKVEELFETKFLHYNVYQKNITKLSIVGYGITQDNKILSQLIDILNKHNISILEINLAQSKIEVLIEELDNSILEEIHKKLIK